MKISDIHTPHPNPLRVDEAKNVGQTDAGQAVSDSGRLRSGKDQVALSVVSKDMQLVKAALDAAPDVRIEQVQNIRQEIGSGEYVVSPSRIAEKIIG